MRYTLVFIGLLMVCGTNSLAAAEALEKLPGYIDFSGLEQIEEGDSEVEVMIRDPLLRMVVAATRKDDPELADLLAKLQLIRVQIFASSQKNRAQIDQQVQTIKEKLKKAGWETVVRVREKGEHVYVNLKMVNDDIVGLCVIVNSADEAVFINIIGDIDPEALGRIGRKFNIAPLQELGLEDL